MGNVKWIKITVDVFDNWKIKHIKNIPEIGHSLVCVWFELLCMAGSCNQNGMLVMSNRFVATDELIADTFNEDIKLVRLALQTFEEHGMIEIDDNNAIQISNWEEYQSAEKLAIIREYEAEKKAKSRAKQKEKQMSIPMSMDKSKDSSISISLSLSNNNSNNINNNKDINILINNIINKYPNKYSMASGQKKLIDILMNTIDGNTECLAEDISSAIDIYLEEHKKNNPDDSNYKFVPKFNKWLEEDMGYWLSQINKKDNSESWEFT